MKEFDQVGLEKHIEDLQNGMSKNGFFRIRTANQCLKDASKRPIPKKLFDEFWVEGEICIMFSDTNLGKSIKAVQIADSISKGITIRGFSLEALPQIVLLIDFELSEKQFEKRYSKEYKDHYPFDDKFYRIEIDLDSDMPEINTEEAICREIENAVTTTNAKIIIIDNITYLANELDKARGALPLMKHLKALKQRYGLSILVLSHTPKRDPYKPLTKNDLQGSRMLMNFCDSSFAIGESFNDHSLRYLKQIKVRDAEFQYHEDNVAICQINKPGNMVQFEFLNYGYESDHLKQRDKKDKDKMKQDALSMKGQGLTNVSIAEDLGVSEGTIRVWVKSKNS